MIIEDKIYSAVNGRVAYVEICDGEFCISFDGDEAETIRKILLSATKEYVGTNNNLRALRKRNGLTQQELADAVGLDRTMILFYEKGKKEISVKRAKDIARVLGVNWKEIFKD